MKPIEQANKLVNGCGNLMGFPADNPRVKCGDKKKTSNGKRICSSCKKAIAGLKIAFKNELEKWEEIWNRNLLDKPKKEYNEGQMEFIKKQIEELKQAIKILEEWE